MKIVLRVPLAVLAIFLFIMGVQYLLRPVATGAQFGLEAIDLNGLSSLRSFNGPLFIGLGLLLGLRLLGIELSGFLTVALFEGLVVIGRLVSMTLDGTSAQLWVAVAIEVTAVVLLIAADRVRDRRRPQSNSRET